MEDRVIIVSCDSHAGVPKELWPEYLPKKFHELLPQLHRDNDEIYPNAIFCIGAKVTGGKGGAQADNPEHQRAQREDWHGLYDPVLRIADMDREGIAAELVYLGDSRLGDMFHNVHGPGLRPRGLGSRCSGLEPLLRRRLRLRARGVCSSPRPSDPA